jgi:hypothetical protein
MPVGAAFPSRRELTEPAPFSNLDPWPSHIAEPDEIGISEVTGERCGEERGSRGTGKIWFSGQSRTSRVGIQSGSSAEHGLSRRGKGAVNLGEWVALIDNRLRIADLGLASV